MPFQPGQLAGDYEVLDVLGKGGMGHVYRVRNVISDRIEAMKVLLDDIGSESGLEDRFIAEIRTLARLDHPNIAKLHTAFKSQKQLLMVMEFIEGSDLAQRAKEGSIPVYKVLGYIKEVLAALTYAHRHGVVHRDIKPSNIMLTSQGAVKLMDFGIAKSNAEPLLTRPGTTLGSLLYMSPEQVRGNPVDARSDLYSVGVVLYELTAGRCPFEAESTYQILDAQLNAAPAPPIEINSSLPKALNEIILTALEKDPAKRFQNADAFRKVLDSVKPIEDGGRTRLISDSAVYTSSTLADSPTPAPPGAMPPPKSSGFGAPPSVPPAPPLAVETAKPQGRRSLWMAAGVVACLCVLAAAVVAVPHFRKSSAASTSSVYSAGGTPGTASITSPQDSPPAVVRPARGSGKSIGQTDADEIRTALREIPSGPSPAPAKRFTKNPVPSPRPAKAVPTQQTSQTPSNQEPPPNPPEKQTPPPAGPSQQDLDKVNESLVNMQARIEAVGQSLTTMKQQQAAMGVGLRGDMVASESRMNSYFQMAERALQSKNVDSAQKYLERTDEEVTKLEHFLGR